MDATVVIGTHGSDRWLQLAERVAVPSAERLGVPVVHHHDAAGTVASARNAGAGRARSEWLIFLDADDELEPGYLEALDAPDVLSDLRAPAIRYVEPDWWLLPAPLVLSDRDIDTVNPCCIGTAIRSAMFADIGGFWEWPAWEDWCLFRRAWLRGATIEHVPGAVYRANVNDLGRNSTVENPHRLHRQIRRRHAEWNARR